MPSRPNSAADSATRKERGQQNWRLQQRSVNDSQREDLQALWGVGGRPRAMAESTDPAG